MAAPASAAVGAAAIVAEAVAPGAPGAGLSRAARPDRCLNDAGGARML